MESKVQTKLETCEADLRRHLADMRAHAEGLKNVRATDLNISTMTVLVTLNVQDKIDLEHLVRTFPTMAPTIKNRPAMVKDPEGRVTRRGKVRNTFYNQISVWYADDKARRNIKVFRNGSLHITGERSLRGNIEIAHEMAEVLARVLGIPVPVVSDFDIQMINTNFKIDVGIILGAMREAMARHPQVTKASYDPETYPGLNCKYATTSGRAASVLTFNSGNIIITGLKSFQEFRDTYVFITGFVDANLASIRRQTFVPVKGSGQFLSHHT
jgi:TATA-box binding protein (TBP) (component of TFIID and TFIIIB)